MTPKKRHEEAQQMNRELAQRNAEHETTYQFGARSQAEVELIAAGIVPSVMKAQAMAMLRFDDMLAANALKPESGADR